MRLFGKKGPESMAGGRGTIPMDRVRELSSKGFSEPDVIDVLRKEGYSPDEIDRALTHSLKAGVTAPAQQQPQPQLPTLEQLNPNPPQQPMPQVPETSLPENYYYDTQYYQESYPQQSSQPQQITQPSVPTEEYVEYLVRERMGQVDQKVNEFTVRYQELEKRMVDVHDQLENLAKARTTEEQLILSKIDSFKDVMSDVDIRMGSLEKAFKDTLPALIESVRALSDLVQRMKREG